ncbi:unnamed protein product [Amoebophrya sp. A120]|nr:unnamed protein product [Amoebophrya sp. A120]|eukprot:GSA120T00008354001.1
MVRLSPSKVELLARRGAVPSWQRQKVSRKNVYTKQRSSKNAAAKASARKNWSGGAVGLLLAGGALQSFLSTWRIAVTALEVPSHLRESGAATATAFAEEEDEYSDVATPTWDAEYSSRWSVSPFSGTASHLQVDEDGKPVAPTFPVSTSNAARLSGKKKKNGVEATAGEVSNSLWEIDTASGTVSPTPRDGHTPDHHSTAFSELSAGENSNTILPEADYSALPSTGVAPVSPTLPSTFNEVVTTSLDRNADVGPATAAAPSSAPGEQADRNPVSFPNATGTASPRESPFLAHHAARRAAILKTAGPQLATLTQQLNVTKDEAEIIVLAEAQLGPRNLRDYGRSGAFDRFVELDLDANGVLEIAGEVQEFCPRSADLDGDGVLDVSEHWALCGQNLVGATSTSSDGRSDTTGGGIGIGAAPPDGRELSRKILWSPAGHSFVERELRIWSLFSCCDGRNKRVTFIADEKQLATSIDGAGTDVPLDTWNEGLQEIHEGQAERNGDVWVYNALKRSSKQGKEWKRDEEDVEE